MQLVASSSEQVWRVRAMSVLNSMTESAMTGEVTALQPTCIKLHTSLWQVRHKACAEDAQDDGLGQAVEGGATAAGAQ